MASRRVSFGDVVGGIVAGVGIPAVYLSRVCGVSATFRLSFRLSSPRYDPTTQVSAVSKFAGQRTQERSRMDRNGPRKRVKAHAFRGLKSDPHCHIPRKAPITLFAVDLFCVTGRICSGTFLLFQGERMPPAIRGESLPYLVSFSATLVNRLRFSRLTLRSRW